MRQPATARHAWRLLDDGRHSAEFYGMWRAAASAGFTIPMALEAMGPRQSVRLEEARQWLLAGTRRGRGLSEVVAAGSDRFEPLECALLTLGDEAGQLEPTLRLLADLGHRKQRMMLHLRKQLAYPLFTGILATFIVPFPLLFFGHVVAYAIAVGIGAAGWLLAGGSVIAAATRHYERKPAFVCARFARALSTAIEAGLPLGRSLRLASDASGDAGLRAQIAAIDERTLTSQPIAVSLAGWSHSAPALVSAIETASLTGDFTTTLKRLADLYEDGFR